MLKMILAIIGAVFVVLFLVGVGMGVETVRDCSKQSYTQAEFQSCVNYKTARY